MFWSQCQQTLHDKTLIKILILDTVPLPIIGEDFSKHYMLIPSSLEWQIRFQLVQGKDSLLRFPHVMTIDILMSCVLGKPDMDTMKFEDARGCQSCRQPIENFPWFKHHWQSLVFCCKFPLRIPMAATSRWTAKSCCHPLRVRQMMLRCVQT